MDPEYEVALSFAGEQRPYVQDVARLLETRGINVFYDGSDQESVRLWGLDLAEEFHRIYSKASFVVVMFVSSDYASKAWTRHERRSAIERALSEKREYILPARFDDTELPGIPSTIAYLSLANMTPEDVARNIGQKLVHMGARLHSEGTVGKQWLAEGVNRTPGLLTVSVRSPDDAPVDGAQVGVVRANGTAIFARTDSEGVASVSVPGHELVTVFVAHPEHAALLVPQQDSEDDLRVRLSQEPNVGSVIFESSIGYLPGLSGRLNPIDDHGRFYVYGDNLSAEGRPATPALFVPGKPIPMEDAEGHRLIVTFVSVVGNHSLIRFERP